MRNSCAVFLFAVILAVGTGCGGSSGTPPPQTTPTSSPSPPVLSGTPAITYVATLLPALDAVSTAVTGIPAQCGPSNERECRAALQKVHDANAELEKKLAATAVPGCLREADSELRTSTKLMDEAMHNGLDGQSYHALQEMSRELEEAGTRETRAMDLLQNASC